MKDKATGLPQQASTVSAAEGGDAHPRLQGIAAINAAAKSEDKATIIPEHGIKRMVLEVAAEPIDKKASPGKDFEGAAVLITDDGRGIAKNLQKLFMVKKATVEILDLKIASDEGKLQAEIGRIGKSMKLNAIIHLSPLEESKPIEDMSFTEWRGAMFRRVKSLYMIAKAFQKDLIENAQYGSACLVSLTGMGGTFGIEQYEASDPIAGGVTGLTKSLNKELGGVLVKSIDISPGHKPMQAAKKIMEEIRLGGRRVEVGYVGDKRMVTRVVERRLDPGSAPKHDVEPGAVFVVAGGGYGITAEIAKDLAAHLKVRLALVSIEKLPENTAQIAAMSEPEFSSFKDTVVNGLKASNERVTPMMIQKELGKYTTALDIYRNIVEMKALGAPDVEYYSCDVTNPARVAEVLAEIRKRFGAINGIIHGAGLEQSKLMEDKKYEDFCRVLDVKADGAFNLVELTKNDAVRYFIPFASISGRFGNIGQTDYSAANDLLNKYSQLVNRRFADRGTRAVSMNWTGWKDVGMATRGSIARIFEQSGIDMIPLEVGRTKVREELLFGGDAEVLVAGNVGQIDCDAIVAGPRTKDFLAASSIIHGERERYPMIDELAELVPGKRIVVKKKLDPNTDLYLADHAIDGVPYFPAVMGIEAFSETALLLFPDKRVRTLKNVEFKYPVKLLKEKPVEIIITLEAAAERGGDIEIAAKIESEFFSKDGAKLGGNRLHFRADMILSENPGEMPHMEGNGIILAAINRRGNEDGIKIKDKEIYKRLFHGPKFQVHGGVLEIDKDVIVGKIAVDGAALFSTVAKPRFVATPMFLEAALQNAGIYGMVTAAVSSLPEAIGEISFKPVPDDVSELYVWARHVGVTNGGNLYHTQIVDKDGNVYAALRDYRMINTGELTEGERFE
ncbi:MAG: hypothetical protein A2W19_07535 [Spirochaetes bacterium RBG_16_49_21]|nr:MAG: hypothetical protein A2W19_07535 [Spirochaetes bacterium RBG_16_49_21]